MRAQMDAGFAAAHGIDPAEWRRRDLSEASQEWRARLFEHFL